MTYCTIKNAFFWENMKIYGKCTLEMFTSQRKSTNDFKTKTKAFLRKQIALPGFDMVTWQTSVKSKFIVFSKNAWLEILTIRIESTLKTDIREKPINFDFNVFWQLTMVRILLQKPLFRLFLNGKAIYSRKKLSKKAS